MAARIFSGMGGARLGLGRLGRLERTRSMVERAFLHPQQRRMLGSSCQWPDGKPFDVYDMFGEFDLPSNVEMNKKENAWAADSIPERNRWRDIVTQKLRDCEAAKPILQRLTLTLTDSWPTLKESLSLIFLPPLALLIGGWLLGWIARGFRTIT
jgi:hypothetical protein